MEQLHILYIGRHPEIKETVVRLLNNNEQWTGAGACTDEEALAAWSQHAFDIVLLGSGIEEENEQKLSNFFRQENPRIIIIRHYGGGSGLLTGEIMQALDNNRLSLPV